jgi:hypothetical protein
MISTFFVFVPLAWALGVCVGIFLALRCQSGGCTHEN